MTQVLAECYVAATRKLGVATEIARRKVELFTRLHLAIIESDDVLAAIDSSRLNQVSFWDALIVRSAQESGCSVLYSEDLQHGRKLGGLDIRNPFA